MKKNIEEGKLKLNKIDKIYKPSISMRIIISIILAGPYANLIAKICIKDYTNILIYALIGSVCLVLIQLIWTIYFIKYKKYKRNAKSSFDEIY